MGKNKKYLKGEKSVDENGKVERIYGEEDPDQFNDLCAEIVLHGQNDRQKANIKRYLNKTIKPKAPKAPIQRQVFSIILTVAYIDGKADWVKDSGKLMFIKRTRVLFKIEETPAHHIYQTVRSKYTNNYDKDPKFLEEPLLKLQKDFEPAFARAMQLIGNYFPDYTRVL